MRRLGHARGTALQFDTRPVQRVTQHSHGIVPLGYAAEQA